MNSQSIPAIDVHGHYGRYQRSYFHPLINRFMTRDAMAVAARAKEANIELTIVSPLLALFPRGRANAVDGNAEAARVVPRTKGLRQWVVIHPRQKKTYEQAREMLQTPTCLGIKIHPEEHLYPIRTHGRAIFEFAAQHRAVVLTHAGEANSLPKDFVPLANAFPEVTLILAHLGLSTNKAMDPDWHVRAIQASKHGNIYADTSSIRSIFPGLIEMAVKKVGADRVLFGTDTPLYFAANQRARIDHADISGREKRMILRDNALRCFRHKLA